MLFQIGLKISRCPFSLKKCVFLGDARGFQDYLNVFLLLIVHLVNWGGKRSVCMEFKRQRHFFDLKTFTPAPPALSPDFFVAYQNAWGVSPFDLPVLMSS